MVHVAVTTCDQAVYERVSASDEELYLEELQSLNSFLWIVLTL